MRGSYFLDTNIIVYTFDRGSPKKQRRARELVGSALQRGDGIISFQVIQEFLNVALQKFDHPMSVSDAQLYLTKVLVPLCQVFPDSMLYSQALMIKDETRFSFFDSLIVAAALTHGCKVLYSEDLKDKQTIRDLEIQNPFSSAKSS